MYYVLKGDSGSSDGNIVAWKDDPEKPGFARFHSVIHCMQCVDPKILAEQILLNWSDGDTVSAVKADSDFQFETEDYEQIRIYACFEQI